MNKQQLFEHICRKNHFFASASIPTSKNTATPFTGRRSHFAFNKVIIDATADLCVAYKPNLAFYESLGIEGWKAFEKTVRYIKGNHPDQFIIADAKRGDIGNTSEMYARSFSNISTSIP